MGIVAWYLPYLMGIDEELNKSEDFFRVFEASSGHIDNTTGDEFEMDEMDGKIEFKDVDFAYPTRPDNLVFQNMSMVFEAGKQTALVGATGCGKSSAVSLLQRFYDPSKGRLTIGGPKAGGSKNLDEYLAFSWD